MSFCLTLPMLRHHEGTPFLHPAWEALSTSGRKARATPPASRISNLLFINLWFIHRNSPFRSAAIKCSSGYKTTDGVIGGYRQGPLTKQHARLETYAVFPASVSLRHISFSHFGLTSNSRERKRRENEVTRRSKPQKRPSQRKSEKFSSPNRASEAITSWLAAIRRLHGDDLGGVLQGTGCPPPLPPFRRCARFVYA